MFYCEILWFYHDFKNTRPTYITKGHVKSSQMRNKTPLATALNAFPSCQN